MSQKRGGELLGISQKKSFFMICPACIQTHKSLGTYFLYSSKNSENNTVFLEKITKIFLNVEIFLVDGYLVEKDHLISWRFSIIHLLEKSEIMDLIFS